MRKRVDITVSGRVQGVSFRAYAQQEARRLGLAGHVRNLPGGEVEIVAEGEDSALQSLVAWARCGPPLARVLDIQVQYSHPSGDFRDFEIRYY